MEKRAVLQPWPREFSLTNHDCKQQVKYILQQFNSSIGHLQNSKTSQSSLSRELDTLKCRSTSDSQTRRPKTQTATQTRKDVTKALRRTPPWQGGAGLTSLPEEQTPPQWGRERLQPRCNWDDGVGGCQKRALLGHQRHSFLSYDGKRREKKQKLQRQRRAKRYKRLGFEQSVPGVREVRRAVEDVWEERAAHGVVPVLRYPSDLAARLWVEKPQADSVCLDVSSAMASRGRVGRVKQAGWNRTVRIQPNPTDILEPAYRGGTWRHLSCNVSGADDRHRRRRHPHGLGVRRASTALLLARPRIFTAPAHRQLLLSSVALHLEGEGLHWWWSKSNSRGRGGRFGARAAHRMAGSGEGGNGGVPAGGEVAMAPGVVTGGEEDAYGEDRATEDQPVTPWAVCIARYIYAGFILLLLLCLIYPLILL